MLRPKFQRGAVWKPDAKSLLVDSVLRGYPIPTVILQQEFDPDRNRSVRRVVDGQQRLRTLIGFVDAECLSDPSADDDFVYRPFGTAGSSANFRYDELESWQRQRIIDAAVPAILLHPGVSLAEVLEIYDRLNTKGEPLNNQEARYAKFAGPFAALCYRLARFNQQRWTGWGLFREAQIARMAEVEFASELVLQVRHGVVKTGKKEIDQAYSHDEIGDEQLTEDLFQTVMDILDDALRLPVPREPINAFRTRAWIYSLFSLLLFWMGRLDSNGKVVDGATLSRVDARLLRGALEGAAEEFRTLKDTDVNLARAVSGAASDRRARMRRFEFLMQAAARR